MLKIKAREAAGIIFKVLGMTQLKITPSLLASKANALVTLIIKPQSWLIKFFLYTVELESD